MLIPSCRFIVGSEIVCIGYSCPICKHKVAVLRSCDPIPKPTDVTYECECGFMRCIRIAELQSLEVWRHHTDDPDDVGAAQEHTGAVKDNLSEEEVGDTWL